MSRPERLRVNMTQEQIEEARAATRARVQRLRERRQERIPEPPPESARPDSAQEAVRARAPADPTPRSEVVVRAPTPRSATVFELMASGEDGAGVAIGTEEDVGRALQSEHLTSARHALARSAVLLDAMSAEDATPASLMRAEFVHRALERHAKLIEVAEKQEKRSEKLRRMIAPVTERFGRSLARLAREYVPADVRASFLEEVRGELERMAGEVELRGEQADKAAG